MNYVLTFRCRWAKCLLDEDPSSIGTADQSRTGQYSRINERLSTLEQDFSSGVHKVNDEVDFIFQRFSCGTDCLLNVFVAGFDGGKAECC